MTDVTPPELARLLDVGERPRSGGWSLRAALTRFGQPRAQLASELTEVLRRLEGALKPYGDVLQSDGASIVRDLTGGADVDDDRNAGLLDLLRVTVDLDAVADLLAVWAADISSERPDAAIETAAADLAGRLDALGIPREERQRPGRGRGRGV